VTPTTLSHQAETSHCRRPLRTSPSPLAKMQSKPAHVRSNHCLQGHLGPHITTSHQAKATAYKSEPINTVNTLHCLPGRSPCNSHYYVALSCPLVKMQSKPAHQSINTVNTLHCLPGHLVPHITTSHQAEATRCSLLFLRTSRSLLKYQFTPTLLDLVIGEHSMLYLLSVSHLIV
jgi:hypothetical protein